MTVKELIEQLKKLPEDTKIVIEHSDAGYYDCHSTEKIEIAVDWYERCSWRGPHEDARRAGENNYWTGKFAEVIVIKG